MQDYNHNVVKMQDFGADSRARVINQSSNYYSTTSTTTTKRARARVIGNNPIDDFEDYARAMGRRATPPTVKSDIMAMMDTGITAEVIHIAIGEMARAPRPSWRYAMAILARCQRQHIRTAEDYQRAQDAWYGREPQRSQQRIEEAEHEEVEGDGESDQSGPYWAEAVAAYERARQRYAAQAVRQRDQG